MPFPELNARQVCELLAAAGCPLSSAELAIEARDERWLVRLPGDRLAWFAASDEGLRRLRSERRVLRLLDQRCGFGAPRVQWIRERLPTVVDDPQLIAGADAVMAAFEAVPIAESDRALVHADVGLHNMAIDPQSLAVRGVFDYEGAAWADRHHDFRYLVFDFDRFDLLDAAMAAYRTHGGRPIQRERVLLYNAACALTFLAYRAGTLPEQRSCGRTLAEDLRWSRMAIARLGASS